MQKKIFLILVCALCTISQLVNAQGDALNSWFLKDLKEDGYPGVSAEKTYNELLKNKKKKTVVVAILDSGVESDHEDLKDVMWVNPGEIPYNGKDDDKNGYVDDINGWNFIGGKDGNVNEDTYETTRLYGKMRYKYENADPEKIDKSQKEEYKLFLKLKHDVEGRRKSAQANLDQIIEAQTIVFKGIDALATVIGDKPINNETLDGIDEGDSKSLSVGINIAKQIVGEGGEISNIQELRKNIETEIAEGKKHFEVELNYSFNPDFDSRKIVGDNIDDVNERYYGNNEAEGPDASHGTHVAGIVAAARGNNLGMDGVANAVRIMTVRCVPNGDERDKDVANAIRYAVDNGATIINMSFGKGHSPQKQAVDDAVKYAEKHDVLLIHASGNARSNNDKIVNYPNKYFAKKKFLGKNAASNWLEVGALSYEKDENMVASFSNYGKKSVDLFAPGVKIYSTYPGNTYKFQQGTSMASPVAAGVAGILRAYFPELTASQVKNILTKSVVKPETKIVNHATGKEVYLSELCSSGGIINAFSAVQLAKETKGKNKVRKDKEGNYIDEYKKATKLIIP